MAVCLQDLPAHLGFRQGGGQAGPCGQGIAGERPVLPIAEAEADAAAAEGCGSVLRQFHHIRPAESPGKLHLPQQHAAQDQVLGHHHLRLGAHPGAELSVDQQEPHHGAGERRQSHHAAKQLPEKTQRLYPSNR